MQNPILKIKCPEAKCRLEEDLQTIYERVMAIECHRGINEKTFEIDTLEIKSLEYYLTHAEDVRKCPKSTCKYSGFI